MIFLMVIEHTHTHTHTYIYILFNGNEIECVSQYKYLGIQFCASGSFSSAQKELYSKTLKGYDKLRRDSISFEPNVKNSIHVFDHTIYIFND